MDSIAAELFSLPAAGQGLVVIVRLVAAGLLGAVIGGERELEGIGPLWVPVLSAACAWVILYVIARVEKRFGQPDRA